jgi:hypothetical protein
MCWATFWAIFSQTHLVTLMTVCVEEKKRRQTLEKLSRQLSKEGELMS